MNSFFKHASYLARKTIRIFAFSSLRAKGFGNIIEFGRRSKRNINHIDGILHQVLESRDTITSATRTFEDRFISILDTLEDLDQLSSQLNEDCASLLSLSESDDNPVREMSNSLGPSLGFINDSGIRVQMVVNDLTDDNVKIDQTVTYEGKLDQTFSQLTYLRTLFRVESAPLDQNEKTMFTALVDEISRLQKDVVEIIQGNFKQLQSHKKTVTKMIDRLDTQTRTLFDIVADKRTKMDNAIQTLDSQLQSRISSNAELNQDCQSIGDAIGQAIIALQAQDIISQKLQHTFEISEDMYHRYRSLSALKDPSRRCREFRFIENASIVVINQIHSIKKELSTAESNIRSNLDFITNSIDRIDRNDGLLTESETQNEENKTCGEDLLVALNDAEFIISETESITQEAFTEIEPIRGMASNVTEIILGLSAQLHLIGLNAEVHAAKMDGCHGLRVLSANTSRISLETRSLCQTVSSELDGLAHSLNTNVNEFESLYSEAKTNRQEIEQTAACQKENLRVHGEKYASHEQSISGLIHQLNNLISAKTYEIDLKNLITVELDRVESSLRALSNVAKAEADRSNIHIDIPELMDAILKRYTMESEKSVHLESLGIASQEKAFTSPDPFQIGSGDEFLDTDQEFQSLDGPSTDSSFDQPATEAAAQSRRPSVFDENVELF